MTNFDAAAATWDNNPAHLERSQAIAREITTDIPLSTEWRGLEYGAGTGILGFILKAKLGEMVMMDSSAEMVKMTQAKIEAGHISHLSALQFNLEKENYTGERFDLVTTQMALHHIADIPLILNKFHRILNNGGYLAIADLYKEDGSFHGPGFDGHNGFDPAELAERLVAAGFQYPSYKECFVVKKTVESGEQRAFPVFILIAKK